jgi:hypothetical protein
VTTLSLEFLSIAPLSDLSDVLLLKQSDESVTNTVPGEVRVYAGGRRRLVTSVGQGRTVPFQFSRLSRSQFQALNELVGVPVLIRDQRSTRVAGVFLTLSGREAARRPDWVLEVTFVLDELTWSEIV